MRRFLALCVQVAASIGSKIEVNYLYFLFFLFTVSFFSLFYFVSQEIPLFGVQFFFILYAIGQALLEVLLLMTVGFILKRWTPEWIFKGFIGISFIALLAHYVDFTLLRLMDSSLSYVFKFFFGSGINHLLTAFLALNLNLTMMCLIVAALAFLPLVGIGFYWITHRWTHQKPWHLSLGQIGGALGAIALSLLLLDLIAYPWLSRGVYNKYQKALPLGTTFIAPPGQFYDLNRPIASLRDEQIISQKLNELPLPTRPLPNIYLFVIETLRKDFVTAETAPHLTAFTVENSSFPFSFANANSTYLSWFSLLHSNFPYHWNRARDRWSEGSAPLRLLKKLGYRLQIYSSADLSYFNMDQVLFGADRKLADKIEEYPPDGHLEPWERDKLAIDALARDIDQGRQGTFYLVFLDSTHSEYSFPPENLKFEPICKEISYLTIGSDDPSLELLKNRYRNAISYVDSLMGRFFETLKIKELYQESIIAVTGDHGEEFFEYGALFHGTHLNSIQTSVPLLCKFQNAPWRNWIPSEIDTITHMDLLPTLLHYLTGQSDLSALFDGESLFAKHRRPYRIAVLQNGADTPLEFTLEKGQDKIHARFLDTNFESSKLELLDLSPGDQIEEELQKAIGPLCRVGGEALELNN